MKLTEWCLAFLFFQRGYSFHKRDTCRRELLTRYIHPTVNPGPLSANIQTEDDESCNKVKD